MMRLIKGYEEAPASSLPIHKFIIPALFLISLLIWGENVHYGHSYMFIICGVAALSFVMENIALSTFGIYLACWLAYLLTCGFRNLIPEEILVQSLDGSLFIIVGMAFYIAVRRSTTRIESYMNGICLLTLILSFIALIQYFLAHGDPGATLGNRNFYAAFMAITLPMFFRKRWYKFIPVLVLGLIIAKTSTAIAAALIASAFFMWSWRGAGVAIIPAVTYYLVFKLPVHSVSLGARLDYWTDALGKMSNSWQTFLFGVGPGVYWQFQNELHSEPVYLLFNLGIIGLLIVAAYIFQSFRKSGDRRLRAALLAVVVDSFGNHVMHTTPTALLAIIIFALKDRETWRAL